MPYYSLFHKLSSTVKSELFAPVVQQSLSRQIADQIRQAILDGTLEADERLPTEDELAMRFGVSRPTIREALKRLAAQNLVRSKRGPAGGTFINRPSLSELSENLASTTTLLAGLEAFSFAEVLQTRRELETLCCRLAAQQRTEEDLARLQEELDIQADPGLSAEDLCASDVRFHRAIANATGNRMLSFVMHAVIESLQPVANMVSHRYRERTLIHQQHNDLLNALRDCNADAAMQAVNTQLDYIEQLCSRVQAEKQPHPSA